MENNYKVLVPTDFTDEARSAISHAAYIANSFSGSLVLLHVISSDKAKEKATTKIKEEAEKASNEYGLKVDYTVRKGSIFDLIPDVAKEMGTMLIVMGTHGVKGIQHITGSHALKVIAQSKVPFIVTQDKLFTGQIKNIVLPVKFSGETKSKLPITASIAKHFEAVVRIFMSNETDELFRKRVNLEIAFAKNFFDDRGVKYEIDKAEKTSNFIPQMIEHANKVNADMIAIVNSTADSGFLLSELFGGSSEVEVLNNKYQIPTIVTNPSQIFVPGSFK